MRKEILFEPFDKQKEFLSHVFNPDGPSIIFYGGSIRSGKTFAGLGALILLCKKYPGSRWAIVRKDLPTIKRNTLPSWDKIKPKTITFNGQTMEATFGNRSKIIFFAESYSQDPELNRWKGLEVNGFLLEESNELQEGSFDKAIERAGSYIIPDTEKQPRPLIMATTNPSYGWIKHRIYDKYIENELPEKIVFIKASIFDNTYISEAYKETLKGLPRYQYRVFVLGDWDARLKTGGEFFSSFEPEKHIKPINVNPDLTIHVSIDENVLPYIAVSLFQIIETDGIFDIEQVHELPMEYPHNSAQAAGTKLARYLNSIGYEAPVMLYGDPSTKSRNAIDPQKRSFFDLFVKGLSFGGYGHKDLFMKKAPIVAATGQFINDIYGNKFDHLRLNIAEHCAVSINDYIDSKIDINGGILKKKTKNEKGQTYETNGHFSDCKRYFLCKAFEQDFKGYKRKTGFGFTSGQLKTYNKNY